MIESDIDGIEIASKVARPVDMSLPSGAAPAAPDATGRSWFRFRARIELRTRFGALTSGSLDGSSSAILLRHRTSMYSAKWWAMALRESSVTAFDSASRTIIYGRLDIIEIVFDLSRCFKRSIPKPLEASARRPAGLANDQFLAEETFLPLDTKTLSGNNWAVRWMQRHQQARTDALEASTEPVRIKRRHARPEIALQPGNLSDTVPIIGGGSVDVIEIGKWILENTTAGIIGACSYDLLRATLRRRREPLNDTLPSSDTLTMAIFAVQARCAELGAPVPNRKQLSVKSVSRSGEEWRIEIKSVNLTALVDIPINHLQEVAVTLIYPPKQGIRPLG